MGNRDYNIHMRVQTDGVTIAVVPLGLDKHADGIMKYTPL